MTPRRRPGFVLEKAFEMWASLPGYRVLVSSATAFQGRRATWTLSSRLTPFENNRDDPSSRAPSVVNRLAGMRCDQEEGRPCSRPGRASEEVGGVQDRPRKWVQVTSQERCASSSPWRLPAGGQSSPGATQVTLPGFLSVSAPYSSFSQSAGSPDLPLVQPQSRSSRTRLCAVSP